jgi:hypothetical protein
VFSSDGRWLASTGVELVLWETASGQREVTLVSALRDLVHPIIAFADGHTEYHWWRWPKKELGNEENNAAANAADLEDLPWLQVGLPEP